MDKAKADLRSQLLSMPLPTKTVDIGGFSVEIRGLTSRQRDQFESSITQMDPNTGEMTLDQDNVRAKMVVQVCYDPATGERVFSDADVEAVGAMPAALLAEVFKTAQELSGTAVTRASENLETAQTLDSDSD